MGEIKYKAEGVVKVNPRLNVRQGNGTHTSIIGKLYTGDKVTISHKTDDRKFNDLGTMRNGYKISYKGASAYVCDRYVTITKEYKDEDSGTADTNKPSDDADVFMLTGKAKILPNLDIKVRDTVDMQGLGKYLSGAFFVEEVTYTFSKSGFTQEISVSKNAFGSSINTPPPKKDNNQTNPPKPQGEVKPQEEKVRIHKLKDGETLWSMAVKYYGSGTKWVHIAKANGIDPNDDKTIRSLRNGREFKIPYL